VVRWHGSFSDSQRPVNRCDHAKLPRIKDARNHESVISLVTARECSA